MPVKLADYKGKVVLRQFLGDLVRPLQDRDPRLRRSSTTQYKDKGLVIVGVSIDDSPEQLQAFMKEFKMNYPVRADDARRSKTACGPVLRLPDVVHRRARRIDLHQAPRARRRTEQFETEIKALLVS